MPHNTPSLTLLLFVFPLPDALLCPLRGPLQQASFQFWSPIGAHACKRPHLCLPVSPQPLPPAVTTALALLTRSPSREDKSPHCTRSVKLRRTITFCPPQSDYFYALVADPSASSPGATSEAAKTTPPPIQVAAAAPPKLTVPAGKAQSPD